MASMGCGCVYLYSNNYQKQEKRQKMCLMASEMIGRPGWTGFWGRVFRQGRAPPQVLAYGLQVAYPMAVLLAHCPGILPHLLRPATVSMDIQLNRKKVYYVGIVMCWVAGPVAACAFVMAVLGLKRDLKLPHHPVFPVQGSQASVMDPVVVVNERFQVILGLALIGVGLFVGGALLTMIARRGLTVIEWQPNPPEMAFDDRMRRLEGLKRDGLITEEEYQAAREKIVRVMGGL